MLLGGVGTRMPGGARISFRHTCCLPFPPGLKKKKKKMCLSLNVFLEQQGNANCGLLPVLLSPPGGSHPAVRGRSSLPC